MDESSPQELRDTAARNMMPAPTAPTRSRRKLIITIAVLAILAAGGGFTALIAGMMKSNGAYEAAMARAGSDCRVQEVLGAPLEAGWFVSGSVETSGGGGHADLTIPVRGSNGSGRLYVSATRTAEVWSLRHLQLEAGDADRSIDLLTAAPCAPGAPVAAAAEEPADAAAPAVEASKDPPAPAAAPSATAAKASASGPIKE